MRKYIPPILLDKNFNYTLLRIFCLGVGGGEEIVFLEVTFFFQNMGQGCFECSHHLFDANLITNKFFIDTI